MHRKSDKCSNLITNLQLKFLGVTISCRKWSKQWEKGWKDKLLDALWAYRIAYKTPIGMSPFQLVYGKSCHLLVELEHRAHWAINSWNMDVKLASRNRQKQIAELEEWREKAYHMPSSTRKKLRDGMITESNKKSLRRETKFYYSTPESSSPVKENEEENGKDRTPSSTLHHTAQSPSKTMMVIFSKLTVNV